MACLIDTSILARLANTADPQYTTADQAVMELHHRGEGTVRHSAELDRVP
jgi:predicted nucleic acid-binding protein